MDEVYLAAGRVGSAIAILDDAVLMYDESHLTTYPERSVHGYCHLGYAYGAAGRTEETIEQYEIFFDTWKNSDEGLESVEDARARLVKFKETV